MGVEKGPQRPFQVLLSYRLSETGAVHLGGDGTALNLKRALEQQGFSVYLADGSEDAEKIVAQCAVFVALCSPEYGCSTWTLQELQAAEAARKPIIPCWHSGRYPPDGTVSLLGALQWVPHGSKPLTNVSCDDFIKELVDRLEEHCVPEKWKQLVNATSDEVATVMAQLQLQPSRSKRFQKFMQSAQQEPNPSEQQQSTRTSDTGNGARSALLQPRKSPSALSLSFKTRVPEEVKTATSPTPRVTKVEFVHTLEGHTAGLRSLAVSPNSSTLFSASEDKTIRVWSVGAAGFKLLQTLTEHKGWVWAVAVSSCGQFLYSGASDKMLLVWDVRMLPEQPKLLHTLQAHDDGVSALLVSSDNQRLYSGSDDRTIRIWDVRDITQPPTTSSATALSDGSSRCNSGAGSRAGTESAMMPRGASRAPGSESPAALKAAANGAALPAAVRLQRGAEAGPRLLHVLKGHQGYITSLALRPDGNVLYSSSMDKTIKIWRVGGTIPGPRLLQSLDAHTLGVYSVTLSPDAKTLFSGGEDKCIRTWAVDDRGNAVPLQTLEGHNRWVRSVRLSPDGGTMFSGSADASIGVWRVAQDGSGEVELLTTLQRHTGRIRCVRVSPDGKTLYSASVDATIKVFALS